MPWVQVRGAVRVQVRGAKSGVRIPGLRGANLESIMQVVRARVRASWGLTRGWQSEAYSQVNPIRLGAQAQAPSGI